MKSLALRVLLLAAVVFPVAGPAGTAFAADVLPIASGVSVLREDEPVGGAHGGEGSGVDVVPVAVWTTVGIVASGLLLGVFYLFKRRIGGFPANPEWVAPISIERSETFAKEGDFGDVAPDAHGAHH
ncbi:MAG: hypothetical protein AB7T37_11750 [Dehalococcoidia bacterium]